MFLTDKQLIAIMLLHELHKSGKPVPLAAIQKAARRGISSMQKIAESLKNAGLIKPIKGPGGGYVLARPLTRIRLHEVVAALQPKKRKPIKPSPRILKRIENNLIATAGTLSIAKLIQ